MYMNMCVCVWNQPLFLFTDMYEASKLRRMALRMVADNMVKLVDTEEYKDLVKNHKGLAAEIPAAMVEAMKKN